MNTAVTKTISSAQKKKPSGFVHVETLLICPVVFLSRIPQSMGEHLKLCNGVILLKCFRLAALKDCEEAVLATSSSSCQTQTLIS